MFSFPEMWLSRVILLVTTLTAAPWLEGIEELDTTVLEVGSGTASEQNIIHIPLENFEVDVLINNTTYPIPSQAYVDGEAIVQLDKYQTKVTTLSDDQVMGSSYAKIDSATRAHTTGILSNKFMKAIHALAPAKDTADTPVIATTGPTTDNGRNKLVYKDLITLKRKLDKIQTPKEGRRLVLTSDHINDLQEDRSRFADLLHNMNGTVAPKIAGFEIYTYDANPYFFKNSADSDKWTKRSFQAIPTEGDQEASVCFVVRNVAKKTGGTKQYFKPAADDPDNQTNRLNYRHYFVAMPFKMKYMGAIVSGGDAESVIPEITSISPTTGESGDTITINGQNFTGATAVVFGTEDAASFTVVSDTVITAVVPTLVDDEYEVVVTTPEGDSNAEIFTVEAV